MSNNELPLRYWTFEGLSRAQIENVVRIGLEITKAGTRCIDCDHWRTPPGGGSAVCSFQNYNQTPPEDVQRSGCPEWRYSEIPF